MSVIGAMLAVCVVALALRQFLPHRRYQRIGTAHAHRRWPCPRCSPRPRPRPPKRPATPRSTPTRQPRRRQGCRPRSPPTRHRRLRRAALTPTLASPHRAMALPYRAASPSRARPTMLSSSSTRSSWASAPTPPPGVPSATWCGAPWMAAHWACSPARQCPMASTPCAGGGRYHRQLSTTVRGGDQCENQPPALLALGVMLRPPARRPAMILVGRAGARGGATARHARTHSHRNGDPVPTQAPSPTPQPTPAPPPEWSPSSYSMATAR